SALTDVNAAGLLSETPRSLLAEAPGAVASGAGDPPADRRATRQHCQCQRRGVAHLGGIDAAGAGRWQPRHEKWSGAAAAPATWAGGIARLAAAGAGLLLVGALADRRVEGRAVDLVHDTVVVIIGPPRLLSCTLRYSRVFAHSCCRCSVGNPGLPGMALRSRVQNASQRSAIGTSVPALRGKTRRSWRSARSRVRASASLARWRGCSRGQRVRARRSPR